MTIVLLCPSFYPHIGGVEKHAFEVAKRLSKKGHKVIVIAEDNENRKMKVGDIDVYKFYFGKKGWFKKFRIWQKLFLKRNLIKKADIVHCHDVFFWYLPFRFMYLRKRVYTTFHGYETKFPISPKAIFIRKLSERLSFGNICVGDFIRKWYGTKPSFVTYGAVDKIPGPILKLHKGSKLKILFVGRIEKDTGVEVYSKTLEILGRNKIQFEVCGDGSLKKEFEKFGRVHGFVKNVNKYILKSDIVFASSYLSIIEALNLKKPVFAVYDNPLKRDYLEMSPFARWIFINKSPKRLAIAVKLFKRKPNIKNLESAGEWVSKQTWENVTNLYLNLFEL